MRRRSACTTASSGRKPFTCDFVFASRDLRPRLRAMSVDGSSRASDHQPVLLELG
jgi:endonuclease/exonuclease/phosphatase family metal-dependent hydrolase